MMALNSFQYVDLDIVPAETPHPFPRSNLSCKVSMNFKNILEIDFNSLTFTILSLQINRTAKGAIPILVLF